MESLQDIFNLSTSRTPIAIGVQPVIFPNGAFEVEKWPKEKTNFHIYEELSRKIRGTSKRIGDFSYPLLPIDTFELAKTRSDYATFMANTIPFYTIKGDINVVMKYVKDLF